MDGMKMSGCRVEMEPEHSSEMSIHAYQTTWYHIPGYNNYHSHHYENLKSHRVSQTVTNVLMNFHEAIVIVWSS
jgi:hypothetical protein